MFACCMLKGNTLQRGLRAPTLRRVPIYPDRIWVCVIHLLVCGGESGRFRSCNHIYPPASWRWPARIPVKGGGWWCGPGFWLSPYGLRGGLNVGEIAVLPVREL